MTSRIPPVLHLVSEGGELVGVHAVHGHEEQNHVVGCEALPGEGTGGQAVVHQGQQGEGGAGGAGQEGGGQLRQALESALSSLSSSSSLSSLSLSSLS